ncbi:hypothetical protein LW135_02505 [Helicobacter sp. faydin-H20]|nr:hypothetical protein [Helicobacter anatolicus]
MFKTKIFWTFGVLKMVDSINNHVAINENTNSNPSKKAQLQDQVKNEQESFAKLIEKKAKEAEKTAKKNSKEIGDKEVDGKEVKNTTISEEKKEIKARATGKESPQDALLSQEIKNTSNPSLENIKTDYKDSKTMQNIAQNDDKKLSDVKQLAQDKGLNPTQLEVEHEEVQNESKPVKNMQMSTQELLEQKTKVGSKKPQEISEPLAQALKEINAKDVEERRRLQGKNKIEYKEEGRGERIAIIERGKNLPKNIVDSKIREGKKEEAYNKAFEKFGYKREGVEFKDLVMQEALQEMDKKKTLAG